MVGREPTLGKNAKDLEESDGNIWGEGLFRFNRPMDTSEGKYKPEAFQVPVNKEGNAGTILRVLLHEKGEDSAVVIIGLRISCQDLEAVTFLRSGRFHWILNC